jgi:serine/threonine protein kinase
MIETENSSKGLIYRPIIVDFGLSKMFLQDERANERVGTLIYSSPEILLKGYTHSLSTDIWSTGVILHIMLTGTFPFFKPKVSSEEMIYLIVKGRLRLTAPEFARVTPPAKDLLSRIF